MSTSLRGNGFRIAIVEHQRLFAEALQVALERDGYTTLRVDPSETRGAMSQAVAAVHQFRADTALVNIDSRAQQEGAGLISSLAQSGTAVVVVTGCTDRRWWGACLYLGAVTVLSKQQPLAEVMATLHRVCRGLPVLARPERERLVRIWQEQRLEQEELRARLARLSTRERDVLAQLALGRTVSEIAASRTVAPSTVRTQVKAILAKLEVSSQLAAVGIVHSLGWGRAVAEEIPRDPAGPHHP